MRTPLFRIHGGLLKEWRALRGATVATGLEILDVLGLERAN